MFNAFKISFEALRAGKEDILRLGCSCGWERLLVIPHKMADAGMYAKSEGLTRSHFIGVHGFEPKFDLRPSSPKAIENKEKKEKSLSN